MTSFLGFGGYVPARIVTNDDWSQRLDTSDEWITTRTGIKERRFAADDESTLDLAEKAALVAMKDAGVTPDDLDEIVVATDTPELYTPDTSSLLQHRLGARNVPTYDLGGSGCAGFVQALDVAQARIAFEPKTMLVVGVELISRLLSGKDRSTDVLFGDAAGAVIVGPDGGQASLLGVVSGTDGSKAEILTLQTGGTRNPFTAEAAARGDHQRLDMDGREVFREAVHRMSDSLLEVLDRNDRDLSEVALVIPHQANKRIIDAVGKKLGVDENRVFVNVDRYGNTGSATVPFALWEARDTGRIQSGDLVAMTAFGAGFHWAAALAQF